MKVSVAITTYNHAPFLAQALDSVLAQEVDFDVEIVVCDDQSSDGTADIIADYERSHPGRVKATINGINVGANRNFVQAIESCRGDYIALLDGDDYWTAPDKLQRQVDVLDRDPNCSLVFHPVEVLGENGDTRTWHPPGRRARYDVGDLLKGNFISTGSVMFRAEPRVRFPEWYDESKGMAGDWIWFCLNARKGGITYLDRTMSAYRLHDAGMWTGSTSERVKRLRATNEAARRLNDDFGGQYASSVRTAVVTNTVKIGIQRTAPFVVTPLISLRHRLSGS